MKWIEVNYYNFWRTLLCIVYCCAMYRLLLWEIRLSVRRLSVTNVRCAKTKTATRTILGLLESLFHLLILLEKVRLVSPNFWGWMESASKNTEILTAFLRFVNKTWKRSNKLQWYAIRKSGTCFSKMPTWPVYFETFLQKWGLTTLQSGLFP